MTIDARWISEGCAEARRLQDVGKTDAAADVLRFVEVLAFGKPAPVLHCSACTGLALEGARWCVLHRPEFIDHPHAEPRKYFWLTLWDERCRGKAA